MHLYKEKFGHCDVSKGQTKYIQLADWLAKQRKDKKHKEPRLTKYKINKLEALGVKWSVSSRYGWDNLFGELVRFQKKYGHCRVKQRDKKYKALANWVVFQRGERKVLTKEQRAKLNSIGFIWSIKPRKNNSITKK